MTEEIHALQESLAQDPHNVEAFQALDEIYRAQHDWRALLELYANHPPNGAGDGPGYEDLAAGLREIADSVESKEERGKALVALGDIYIEHLQRREEAMTAYQESFKAWPKDTTCLERARSIYSTSGDYERVIVLYELQSKVLRKMDQAEALARTYVEMAEIFGEHMGDQPRALEKILEARQLQPGSGDEQGLYDRYRASEHIQPRIEQMVIEAEEMAAANPRQAARLLVRAARLERARVGGELETAYLYVERAIEYDSDSRQAQQLLESLLLALDDEAGAAPDQDDPPPAEEIEVAQAGDFERRDQDVTAPVNSLAEEGEDDEEGESYTLEEIDELDDPAEEYVLEEIPSEVGVEETSVLYHGVGEGASVEQDAGAQADLEELEELKEDELEEVVELEELEDLEELEELEEGELEEVEADADAETSEAEEAEEADADDELEAAEQDEALEEQGAEELEEAELEEIDEQAEIDEANSEEELAEGDLVEDEADEDEADEDEAAAAEEVELEEIEEEDEQGGDDEDEQAGGAVEPEQVAAEEQQQEGPGSGVRSLPDPSQIEAVGEETFEAALAALEDEPANLEALRTVQRELMRREDWEEAVARLEHSVRYLRRKDGEFEVMLDLALILWRRQQDWDRAEYFFKRLRHHDSEMPEVMAFYEQYYEREEQWRKLHVHLGSMLAQAQERPARRRVTERMARIAEQQMGSPEKAIDAWRTFLEEHPEDLDARAELRRLYEEHEKWNALNDYLRAEYEALAEQGDEATIPDRIALLEEIAQIYRDQVPGGDINRINTLGELLELDPEHREAFEELKELLESNRRFSELGNLLSEQAEAAAERGDLGRAIELLTDVADLWQEQLNNVTQALPFLTRILELDPHHEATRERLKDVYEKRRDFPSLFELLEQETEQKSGDELEAHLRQLLELAQGKLRDRERAVELLEQLLELAPEDVELFDKLEHIYRRQDAWDKLAALLERKAELDALEDADVIGAYKEAAQLHDVKLEDPERAAELWRRVLVLDEGNATAFARLRDIYIEHQRFDELFELFAERGALDRYYDVLDGVAQEAEGSQTRAGIYRRMADLAEEHLGEERKVISSLEQLLEQTEERPRIARELINWYRQVGELDAEIQMHQLLLEHAEQDIDRFGELVRLAELEIEREQDEAALRWQLEAVAVMPGEVEAVQTAEDLARHVGMLETFLDHIEAIAEAQEAGSELQREMWHRVARLSRDELEDNARAIELFERLHDLEPEQIQWLEALEHLYEVAAYPEQRIEALRLIIMLLEDQGAQAHRIVEQLAKIAQVQHRHLMEQEAAAQTYQRILEIDPDFVPAIQGIREIYAMEERWEQVIEMLEREFDLVGLDDEDRRVELHMEQARVWRDFRDAPAEALRHYADVLKAHPEHAEALARAEELLKVDEVARRVALLIEPLLRDSQQLERLAGALEARLRVCEDEFEEQEILEELVPLYVDRLEQPEAAFPRAARRFELDASNERRWDELEALAAELDRWPEVEALFVAWVPMTEQDEQEHGGRVELLRRIAHLREERLGDKPGALEAWQRLYDFQPTELDVIEALERLHRELGQHEPLVQVLDAKSEVVFEPERRVALLMEAARLTDDLLEDIDRAIILYQRVLDLEQTHADAVGSLERLLRQQERFFDLDDLLAEQANLADDPGRRRDFLLQQAALRTNQLEDPNGAFTILRQLIGEDAEDPRAVMLLVRLDEVMEAEDAKAPLRLDIALELEQLYRSREDYPKLIEILEVRLTFTDEPFDRIELLDELAELYVARAGDHASAFERRREAVVLMPEEEERRGLFEQLGDKLDRLEEVVAAYAEAAQKADPFVAVPLYKRSGQILAQQGENDEAIAAYELALGVDDTDEASLSALEELYMAEGRHEELSGNLAAQARYAEPDRRAELLARIGDLEEQVLDRPVEAIEAWSELLHAEPGSMRAIEALERLHERQEQWVDLAEVLRRKVDLIEEPGRKLEVLHKLALVLEEQLEDVPEAISVYQRMLMFEARHAAALDALDRLFVQEARWPELAEVLRTKLSPEAVAEDEARRTELELRLARILAEELMSVDEALDLYLAVFSRQPGQPDARGALERWVEDISFSERCAQPLIDYYEAEGLWRELVHLYDVLREQAHDPELRAEYNWQIALIERDRLQELPEAQEAMSRAWRITPERDDWRGELIALAEVREAWIELAEVYEDVLMQVSDPDRMKTLRVELAELYRDRLDNAVDAELHFGEALNLDERDLEVYAALEAMLSAQERWQDLIDLLERRYMVFAAAPDAQELLLRIAQIYDEFLEDGFTAVDSYRRVLGEDPREETAIAAVKRLLLAQDRWQDLADFLEDQITLWAEDAERLVALRTELAQIYAGELFLPERALELWRQILADRPHHEPTVASLEQMFAADEAMRQPVAEVLEPIYREQEAWDDLIGLLRTKADAEPDPLERIRLLREIATVSESSKRDWGQAFETWSEIFEQDPEPEDVRAALERLAERLQAWPQVVEVYERTLRDNFNVGDMLRADLLMELGLVHEERLGDLERARATFAQILDEVDPGAARAFDAIERVDVRLEDWEALADLYRRRAEIELDPHESLIWLDRLATLQEEVREDLPEATHVYERMLELEPGDAATQHALERLYRVQERFDDLADLYRRLMDMADDEHGQLMRYRLAQLLESELDQIDEALDLYRAILATDPGHRDTLRALEGLRRDLAARDDDWGMHLIQIADLLLEHYEAGRDWRRIVELLELKQDSSEDARERTELLDRAARVVEEHATERADQFQALELRTRAWCLMPEERETFVALEPLADQLEAWERVIPQVLEGLEFTEDHGEQARLLNNAARVYQDKLQDQQSALLAYEQTLAVDPVNEEAIRQLEGLYGQFEHWESLVRLLGIRLENTYDGEARINLLQRIANLHEEILDQPFEAIQAYEELRELDPGTRSYLDALCVLYERTERDPELAEVLEAKANMLEDPGEQLGTLKKLAQVQHELLSDEVGAVETYRRILVLDDNDEQAVRALVELYAASQSWHELLEMLRLQREFSDSVDSLNQVEFRMAEIMLDHVDQPYEALSLLRGVAERSPGWEPALEVMTGLLDREMVREEAFEALETLHRAEERYEALAATYEKRIGYMEDPHQRTGTYLKLASLQEDHLGAPTRALMTYGRAFRELPSQESVRVQLERVAEELEAYEELIAVYEDALEGDVDDPMARKHIHSRLGELYVDEREEPGPAIAHMEAVLEIDEYDIEALELLDKLYQIEERWQDLADILERKIAVAPPEALAQARYRLGYLRDVIFERPLDGFDLYRQVILEQPEHRGVIEALERLIDHEDLKVEVIDLLEDAYTQASNWGKLSQLLRIKLEELVEGPHERAELMRRIARLERDELEDVQAAFDFFGRALRADPFDLDTQGSLEALAEEQGRWPAIVDLYDQIIGELDDPVRQAELGLKAAGWARIQLEDDLDRAHRLYRLVLEVEPTHEEALAALEGIARQRGDQAELAEVLTTRVEVVFDPSERFAAFVELGGLRAEMDDLEGAIDALRDASMIDESSVEVMEGLIDLYERTERYDDLVDQLERLARAEQDPQRRVEVLTRIGHHATAHLEDPARAMDAYERALELAPQDIELLRAIEPLYSQSGQLDKLGANLDQQLELATGDEDRVRVMVSRARIAHEHYQETEQAIELFQQAYEISPRSPVVTDALDELYRSEQRWVDLFNLYYQQLERAEQPDRRADLAVEMARVSHDKLGDADTAVQYLDFALGSIEGHAEALQVKEHVYTQAGQWAQVTEVLGQQLAAATEGEVKIDVLQRRAALYRDTLDRPQEAIDDLVEVLNIDLGHEEAYAELTMLLNRLEAWEQLFEVMNFRVEAMPEGDQKQMFLDMAEVARKLGDTSRRIDALEAAYQFDTTDLDVVEPLLDAAIDGGHFDRAEPLLEEVIASLTEKRRMKEVVRFYHLRGKLAEQRGDEDAALEAFESARKIDATYVPNLLSLGKLLYRREDWDSALKILQTLLLHQMSIKDNQDKIDMYYYLGQVRLQKDDERRAKDMFNRALSIDSDHQPSKKALEQL